MRSSRTSAALAPICTVYSPGATTQSCSRTSQYAKARRSSSKATVVDSPAASDTLVNARSSRAGRRTGPASVAT